MRITSTRKGFTEEIQKSIKKPKQPIERKQKSKALLQPSFDPSSLEIRQLKPKDIDGYLDKIKTLDDMKKVLKQLLLLQSDRPFHYQAPEEEPKQPPHPHFDKK